MLPNEDGKPMDWEPTLIHTCGPSHFRISSTNPDSRPPQLRLNKESTQCSKLSDRVVFAPFRLDTLGSISAAARRLLDGIETRVRPNRVSTARSPRQFRWETRHPSTECCTFLHCTRIALFSSGAFL